MKTLTDFRKTVKTGVDPRMWIMETNLQQHLYVYEKVSFLVKKILIIGLKDSRASSRVMMSSENMLIYILYTLSYTLFNMDMHIL